MNRTTIRIRDRYLVFPISDQVEKRRLLLYHKGKPIADIDLCLDYVSPTQQTYWDAGDYLGELLEVELRQEIPYQDLQASQATQNTADYYRPRLHFTPPTGWINDPNGLMEYRSPITGNSTYHMFFQYNPYGKRWGNMHWGHTVSSDLIRWEHRPIALHPDLRGGAFSGSAIVDKENRSGLKTGDEDVILLFYTAGGLCSLVSRNAPNTQCVAYSNDGGVTFQKYAGNPIIPELCPGSRDPKVIWCEELGKYVMALYLEKSYYQLMTSGDLLHWQKLQQIHIEGEEECPDFYPLFADGDETQRKWILIGASHRYVVCECTGQDFRVVQDTKRLNHGVFSYASQTFDNISDGRRIAIAWNTDLVFPNAPYNGQMSIPFEMSLRTIHGEYSLCANPAKEVLGLLQEVRTATCLKITPDDPYILPVEGCAYWMELQFAPRQKGIMQIDLFGRTVIIDLTENKAMVGETSLPLSQDAETKHLRLVIDTRSAELIAGQGEAIMTASFICDFNWNKMTISADKEIKLEKLETAKLMVQDKEQSLS